jgi:hypothetical protein
MHSAFDVTGNASATRRRGSFQARETEKERTVSYRPDFILRKTDEHLLLSRGR